MYWRINFAANNVNLFTSSCYVPHIMFSPNSDFLDNANIISWKSVQWVRVYACGRTDVKKLLGAFRDVRTRRKKTDTVNHVIVKWNVVAKWIGRRTHNQMPPPRPLITSPCRTTDLLPPSTSFSLLSFLAAYVTHPTSFFWILVIYSYLLRQPFVRTLFYT